MTALGSSRGTATVPAMATTSNMQVKPGWYPDGCDGGLRRWWDGQRWTSETKPVPVHVLRRGR